MLKKFFAAVFAIMFLASVFTVLYIPTVKAQDQPTVPFIALRPNPVGLGQSVLIVAWLQPVPPTKGLTGSAGGGVMGIRYEGIIIEITKPDGTIEKRGPYTSDPLGIVWDNYAPSSVGTYSIKMTFPGQRITGYNYYTNALYNNTLFKESTSPTIKLTVQEEPVKEPSDTALPGPNDYWERPIQGDNKAWWPIAGNWLMRGYNSSKSSIFDSGGGWNPYTTAPNTAHVLWTKEIKIGGLIGGDYDGYSYYSGLSYECAVTPPIIMNGRLYYNIFTDRRPYLYPEGFICVDLRTGEQIWENPNGTVTCGQILNFISPNQMGGIPYLWAVTGQNKGANQWINWTVTNTPSGTISSPWYMYDAFTGDLMWTLTNTMTGSAPGNIVFDQNGNMIAYFVDSNRGRMVAWNSTKVVGDDIWSYPNSSQWRPPSGTFDWRNGIEWNVSIPIGSGGIHEISSNVIVTRNGYSYRGFSMNDGRQLWGPMNKTWYSGYKASGQGIWVEANIGGYGEIGEIPDMYLYAYSLTTGQQVWKSETPSEYPWGSMRAYPIVTKDAVYDMGYDGYVHAYETKTGKELWKYYSGNTTFETPYGHYPFYHGTPVVADGKVFAATGEHSPTQPLISGERLHVINATTGQGVWNMSGWLTPLAVADGILLAFNAYDNRLYAFGKGKTDTTISISPLCSNLGETVLIQGTVMDQSTGSENTPAIADKDMSSWMEYIHRQKERPNAIGVPVQLSVIDSNGNYREIGVTTSDSDGFYSYAWKPDIEGKYTIYATFEGSESYWPSYTVAAFNVDPSPYTPAPTQALTQSASDTYLLPGIIGIIVAIAIVGIMLALLVTRKRP